MLEKIHHQCVIPTEFSGKRLDWVLAQLFPQYSRSILQQWLRQRQILINEETLLPKTRVKGEETVVIDAELYTQTDATPQEIPLAVIYEDDELLIIDKPPGLVVHPAAGNPDNTLLNALLHHHKALLKLPRAGIVHRLDKDTSGLLVVAKTLTTHHYLVKQLQERHITRIYEAIVQGVLTAGGTVEGAIGRHPKHRTKMAVVEHGRTAVTHYRIIEKFPSHTHLRISLDTGRTHQIRVHMAEINHPIVGDPAYGGRMRLPKQGSPGLIDVLQKFKRQALHARQLQFHHPVTGELMKCESALPEDMKHLLNELREDKKLRN